MTDPIQTTIPAGTEFASCKKYSNGISRDCPLNNKTQNENKGELTYDIDKSMATFYNPDYKSCLKPTESDAKCDVIFDLDQKNLENLAKTSPDINRLISIPPVPPPSSYELPTNSSQEVKQQPPALIIPLLYANTILISIILVIEAVKMISVFNKKTSKDKTEVKRINPNNSLSLNTTAEISPRQSINSKIQQLFDQNFNILSKLNTVEISPMNSNIQQLFKQNHNILSKLNTAASDLQLIANRLTNLERKYPEPIIEQKSISAENHLTLDSHTISQPHSNLSVNLIKQAVSSDNYALISNFSHYFLTETLESQQGGTEYKHFTIDGDQSSSQSHSQSEFIAITCNEHSYLIPNISKNASDPARLLEKLAERNKIYCKGNGNNMLYLERLAIVEKKNNQFVLTEKGQIY